MYEQRRLEELIENEWLGLGDTTSIVTDNPLERRLPEDIERPDLHILSLMRRPEYFSFTCKHVFNKIITPMQQAVLYELWHRPFPMLIACRGFGKCATGDTLVVAHNKICQLQDLVGQAAIREPVVDEELSILGESGFSKVAYSWNNGESATIKLATRYGYSIEGTPNHPVRVVRDGELRWVELADTRLGDYVAIDRSTEAWPEPASGIDDQTAYMFGLMVGDGGYTVRGRLGFTSGDPELADAVSQQMVKLWGKPLKKIKAKYQYEMHSVAAWDELFGKYGFVSPVCGLKEFPKSVLASSRSAMIAFVRGLFDTDGGVNEKPGQVEYSSKSSALAKTMHFVLTRLGIIGCLRKKYNKKFRRYYYIVTISGPSVRVFADVIGFGLARKQQPLERLCKRKVNANTDVVPHGLVLDTLLELYKDWVAVRQKAVRGGGRQARIITPSVLKAYQLTYEKLARLLEMTNSLSDRPAWRRLSQIATKHFYFDQVKCLSTGYAETYDVQVPEGHSFISNGIVSHNSFLLALYSMLRCLLCPGSKIVIVGAAFRQAKVVFEYCEDIWQNAPVFRDICGGETRRNGPRRDIDRCTFRVGDSFLCALPLGTGEKIRGQRANIILADEFATIPVEIFENVVSGFASVSLSPIEKVRAAARKRAMHRLGLVLRDDDTETVVGMNSNQTILSGTAYYSFNHFASYWKRYKQIIESRGDVNKLEEMFNGEIPDKFDWRDYSIVRMPVDMLPEGFMDQRHVSKAKATIHMNQYAMEFGGCMVGDSNGFFKRSLIESCVVGKEDRPITHPSCGEVVFHAALRGDPTKRYVMAVDPASENDNLSIVILECWPEHRRIVYCWTTNRKGHKTKLQKKLTEDQDYYGYVAKKIRELLALFRCERVALDSQGGGVAVLEALGDQATLREGELAILPIIDPEEPCDTDRKEGLHLLELINFARAEWVAEANHGLRFDFESKTLLFPQYDSVVLGTAIEQDKITGRVKADKNEVEALYDTLENCFLEIEELKDELATIVHTQSGATLRDRWDTPEVKMAGGKKGRLRKDRYSSLLMANMVARQLARVATHTDYQIYGGFATDLVKHKERSRPNRKHRNPEWYERATGGNYGAMVGRRGIS